MTREDIIAMALEAKLPYYYRTGEVSNLDQLERFFRMAQAAERNKVAQWMIDRSYATGHGDTTEDLLQELEWQIAENWTRGMVNGVEAEREACAKLCEDLVLAHPGRADLTADQCAAAIRARGQT